MILVADIDTKAARLLAAHLARHGFKVKSTSSGQDVLALARSRRLGLAIVDMALKDMSGPTLSARLKEVNATVPVLMTSADDRPELEMQARHTGIIYYAHKPTNYRRVQAVVEKALRKAV